MRNIFFIIVLLMLYGCSSTSQFINKKYLLKPDKVVVVLFPLTKDVISLTDPNEVYEDFKNDKRDAAFILMDSGFVAMKKTFKDSLGRIKSLELENYTNNNVYQNDTALFFNVKKQIGKDSVIYEFQVPQRKYLLNYVKECDIIVTINKYCRNIMK